MQRLASAPCLRHRDILPHLDEWMTSDLSSSQRPGSARVKPGGFQEPVGPFQEHMTLELSQLRVQRSSFVLIKKLLRPMCDYV